MNTNRFFRAMQSRSVTRRFPWLSNSCFSAAPLALFMVLFWPFSSGTKVQMMASRGTPAAHGEIIVKHSSNGNLDLDIKTADLAAPSSLSPAENVYVVWLQQPDQEPQNLGELRVDKKLDGELHTETAFKRFAIFITAEQNAQEEAPQAPKVLSADVVGS